MAVDWTPVIQAAVTTAAAVIPVAGLLAAAWLRTHGQRMLADDMARAVQTGGGIAYNALVSATHDGTVNWREAEQAAIAKGTAAVAQIALNPSDVQVIATKVKGALGELQAADPTITVGGGSSATAIAAPGQVALAEAGPA